MENFTPNMNIEQSNVYDSAKNNVEQSSLIAQHMLQTCLNNDIEGLKCLMMQPNYPLLIIQDPYTGLYTSAAYYAIENQNLEMIKILFPAKKIMNWYLGRVHPLFIALAIPNIDARIIEHLSTTLSKEQHYMVHWLQQLNVPKHMYHLIQHPYFPWVVKYAIDVRQNLYLPYELCEALNHKEIIEIMQRFPESAPHLSKYSAEQLSILIDPSSQYLRHFLRDSGMSFDVLRDYLKVGLLDDHVIYNLALRTTITVVHYSYNMLLEQRVLTHNEMTKDFLKVYKGKECLMVSDLYDYMSINPFLFICEALPNTWRMPPMFHAIRASNIDAISHYCSANPVIDRRYYAIEALEEFRVGFSHLYLLALFAQLVAGGSKKVAKYHGLHAYLDRYHDQFMRLKIGCYYKKAADKKAFLYFIQHPCAAILFDIGKMSWEAACKLPSIQYVEDKLIHSFLPLFISHEMQKIYSNHILSL